MIGIPLDQARDEHAIDLERLSGLRPNSIRLYRTVYNTFGERIRERLGREPLTTDITTDNVRDYFLNHVAHHAPKSHEAYRSLLNAAAQWCMKRGYLAWGMSPVDEIPKQRKKDITTRNRRLSDAEFEKLLKAAAKTHARDVYLCICMRLWERRIGEVQNLVWGDIRWDEDDIIYDNSKARRHGRKMVLTPELRATLLSWKDYYEKEVGREVKSSWYLFPALTPVGFSRIGRKRPRVLSPEFPFTNPARISRDLLKAAGLYLEEGDGWHIFRKTSTNAVKQTAKRAGVANATEYAKLAADHQDEKTTRVYIDEDDDYRDYKEFRMEHPTISDELASKIPFLAPLVVERRAQQAAAGTPDEPAIPGPNVIDFASRSRQRMVR